MNARAPPRPLSEVVGEVQSSIVTRMSFAARMDRLLGRHGMSLEAISKSEFEDGESWDLFRAVVYPRVGGIDPQES